MSHLTCFGTRRPWSSCKSGVDRALIALWLGHESVETTQIYLDADLALKEQVLAKIKPINAKSGRYRPGDDLLAFLKGL